MMVFYPIFTAIFAAIYLLYYYLTKNHDYWKKRNVPHLKPTLLFGNYKEYIFLRKYSPKVAQEICRKFPNEPYVGVFYGTDPALIIKDPNIIKLVMAKDFFYFNYREISQHTHKELITQNMFFNGGDTWKVLRQNLTALFSSAKMKNMFPLIESCASALEDTLSKEMTNENTIEVKSLLARYTMDCIGSCAFGVNTGTLEKRSSSNPFTIMGEKLFDVSNYGGFRMVSRAMWPTMFYKLGFTLFEGEIEHFFKKLLTDVFESRQYKESSRNDFVDLILGWKKKAYLSGDSITNFNTGGKTTISLNVDDNLLIAQCILFFAAGFETTSTTTSFVLYELSKRKDAQIRVLEEIDDYFQRHEGKIQFECINEMPFVQACIDETLRIYPVLGVLTREVTEDYTLPTGLLLEKGTRVHIPVYDLHHNPENFPDPEEFRPERFFGEEKKNIKQYTYMPFGEGPRICIGMRFARMPIVAGLLTILKNYSVELAEGMPRTVDFQPRALVTQAMQKINIKFIPRKL
ncbi:cytochrome P450 6B7-like [Vanessa cardui]|uniref:cytochrome P450 6B7-like n=1 Tax=Vanessa cardui TaxID=171605 RepID=UPI001F13C337|nr:cytochrome P450 6B7-like [Vanessa cardui]